MTKYLSSVLCVNIILKALIYFLSVSGGLSTDIESLAPIIDKSLGYDVLLPVLSCHSKNTGYHKVTWYKDGVVVKSGSASLSGHMLSLVTLLAKPFPNVLSNPLKLQGYYWCDIDLNFTTKTPEKFLFRIPSVHTYVGSLVAKSVFLNNVTQDDSLEAKANMREYEDELQTKLFAFLPEGNTFVTHLNQTDKGLVIRFYLYAQLSFNPRVPDSYILSDDESQLNYIYDYMNNLTITDEEYFTKQQAWAQAHGVSIADVKLTSTAGCFRDVTGNPGDKLLSWPYTLLGEITVSDEGCLTKNMLAVTRECSGNFTDGAEWEPVLGVCAQFPPKRTAEMIDFVKQPVVDNLEALRQSRMLSENPKELNVLDIHLLTSVLHAVSETEALTTEEAEGIFTVVDNLMHANISNLNIAKGTLRFSTRILGSIDLITDFTHLTDVTITKSSIVFAAKGTKTAEDLIVGVSILPSEQWASSPNDSVKFISNGSNIMDGQSVAGFVLPPDLIMQREKDLSFPCQLNMVYFSDWRLFSDPRQVLHHRNYEAMLTPVIHVGITGGLAWNLSNPIRFYFRNNFKSDLEETPLCAYFDPKLNDGFGGWATEGCSLEGLRDGYYVCHCHHIAMLSLIVPQKPSSLVLFRPSIAIFIGCGISIAILCLVVLFYLSSKTWRICVNHHILFFLAVAMLCSLVLLLIHNIESKWGPGCMFLTIVFHYFVQVTFCWLLVQSLVHHSRFCRDVEIVDMGKFLTRANVFAWDLPFVIVGIVWVVVGSQYYHHKVCWSTMQEISNIIFYPVIVLLLLTLCFNAIAAFYVTCGFFKDLELKTKRQTESSLKFKVALSIYVLFFLSWIFGYLALHKPPRELQILFGISVIVTSLYIFLFFVFHDISPRDLYEKMRPEKKKVSDSTDAIAVHDAKTYNATK